MLQDKDYTPYAMNGRFRKGKKAYKRKRHDKLHYRYEKFLSRIEARKRNAIKMARVALAIVSGAVNIRNIQSMKADPLMKANGVAQAVINSAMMVQKIMQP